jgi:type II secretory pathway pseudopilin PulG
LRPRRLKRVPRQRGVLIVALMAGIAIAMILSGVAAQHWADVVRRENEAEMMFRAQDLVRALKRYQNDQGRLPTTWDELMQPGQKGQYFLRHLWKDPLVKGGKWQTLYASPQGALIDPTAPGVDPGAGTGLTTPGTSPFGPRTPPSGTSPSPGTGFPNQSQSPTGQTAGIGQVTQKDDGTSEISGLPIAGVKSRCTEKPFRVYKDKDDYSQWLFSIFDLEQPAGTNTQANPGNPGSSGNPPPTSVPPSQ